MDNIKRKGDSVNINWSNVLWNVSHKRCMHVCVCTNGIQKGSKVLLFNVRLKLIANKEWIPRHQSSKTAMGKFVLLQSFINKSESVYILIFCKGHTCEHFL